MAGGVGLRLVVLSNAATVSDEKLVVEWDGSGTFEKNEVGGIKLLVDPREMLEDLLEA
jgi:hypothetical protein